MQMQLAIREVETYEVRSFTGPKRVTIHTKIGYHNEEVNEEIHEHIKNLDNLDDFTNREVIVEGTGVVVIDVQGQRYPQAIQFVFPEDVTDKETAFERFDECMQDEISRRQEEEKQAQKENLIQTATQADLDQIKI